MARLVHRQSGRDSAAFARPVLSLLHSSTHCIGPGLSVASCITHGGLVRVGGRFVFFFSIAFMSTDGPRASTRVSWFLWVLMTEIWKTRDAAKTLHVVMLYTREWRPCYTTIATTIAGFAMRCVADWNRTLLEGCLGSFACLSICKTAGRSRSCTIRILSVLRIGSHADTFGSHPNCMQ